MVPIVVVPAISALALAVAVALAVHAAYMSAHTLQLRSALIRVVRAVAVATPSNRPPPMLL